MSEYAIASVSGAAIRHNVQLLRDRIGPGVKLCVVIKADAYGHGLEGVLDIVSPLADWLAVATPTTALRLRDLGYAGPILSMFSAAAYADSSRPLEIAQLVSAEITQTITDMAEIPLIAAVAGDLGTQAPLHLKIDTGMGRSGVSPADAAAAVSEIVSSDALDLTGVYTHFATADEEDQAPMLDQLACFHDALKLCDLPEGILRHAANSAATLVCPDAHLDLVRCGLAVYGYHPGPDPGNCPPLHPCLRVTAPVLQVKALAAGSRCGYGLTYRFERDGRIARLPIGYGDGYLRCLSNRSVVRIRGQEAPVRGRVSMDQLIVDVTDIPGVAMGDEAEIVSPDPDAPNSVEALARQAGTIPYEITCNLRSERIERDYV